MALRMGALYDALRQGQGIGEDEARRAAEEVAAYEHGLHEVRAELKLHRWMLATIIGLAVIIISKVW